MPDTDIVTVVELEATGRHARAMSAQRPQATDLRTSPEARAVLRSGSSSAERNVSANGPVNEFWAHHDLDRCTSLEQSFMSNVDLALSVMPGIGLAAATGFRVFLPMLIVSAAAYRGISSATRFRMRWRLTGRLGRADSNLCISEFEPGPAQHQKRDTKKGPQRQTLESRVRRQFPEAETRSL